MILQYLYCVNFELTRSMINMEKNALKFVWHYVKIFKWFLLIMLALLIVGQICRQFVPYYLARLYEAVSGYQDTAEAWQNVIVCIFSAFLLQFLGTSVPNLGFVLSAKVTPRLRTIVIRDVFDYVNRHSIAYFSEEMSGNISNKVQQLQSGVTELIRHCIDSSYAVFYVLIGLVILSSVSLWLAPVFILWALSVIGLGFVLGRRVHGWSKASGTEQSRANGMIVDSLANYSEIKSFANFRFERLNLLKALRLLRNAESREEYGRARVVMIQHTVVVVSFALFMFYAAWLFRGRHLTSTEFIFVNGLFMTMSGTIFNITWVYNNILRIFGRINSALETLAVEPEIKDRPNAIKPKFKKASVSFEDVDFAYAGKKKLFHGLNLEIKAGEKIGLVGASGSGKSTFIKLIARYFDVSGGAVKINGIDVRDLAQDSLHKNIAAIPQDICLFNRTLMENIRYGKTNASDEEVVKAAKKAAADEFIKGFPDGYQTKVGERGVVLSGGERQRIAIARAILKNAPLLIFDEATSALDSRSEKHIQKSLNNLMKNKTVIAIAHRLSTLREMDRILVFDKGRIVEQGTHSTLLRKKGIYYRLYNMQASGFVGVTSGASTPSRAL